MDTRQWSKADLGRASGISKAMVSNVLNLNQDAGPDVCRDIARAFGISQVEVFRRAGLIDEPEQGELRPAVARILRALDPLDDVVLDAISVQIKTVLIPLAEKLRGKAKDESATPTKRV